MNDLFNFVFSWQMIAGLFIGGTFGLITISMIASGKINELLSQNEDLTERNEKYLLHNQELLADVVKYKTIASSSEVESNLLKRANEDLQTEYNDLHKNYLEVLEDYKKLFIELDSLKANDFKKFRTEEEINFLNELDIIEEMITGSKQLKVKLVS